MKPYPFVLLNHFTVPRNCSPSPTDVSLSGRSRCSPSSPEPEIARSLAERRCQSIEDEDRRTTQDKYLLRYKSIYLRLFMLPLWSRSLVCTILFEFHGPQNLKQIVEIIGPRAQIRRHGDRLDQHIGIDGVEKMAGVREHHPVLGVGRIVVIVVVYSQHRTEVRL